MEMRPGPGLRALIVRSGGGMKNARCGLGRQRCCGGFDIRAVRGLETGRRSCGHRLPPLCPTGHNIKKHFSNHDVKMVSLCGRSKHEFGIPSINSLLYLRSINIIQSKPSASSPSTFALLDSLRSFSPPGYVAPLADLPL